MGFLDAFFGDEKFLKRIESETARAEYLASLNKRRTIALVGLALGTASLLASWFDNTAIVVFFGILIVTMDLDQKAKFVKWIDRNKEGN
jgi:hypothetical protein